MAADAGPAERPPITAPRRPTTGRRRRLWRLCNHPAVIATVLTGAGALIWLTAFPRVGTDLSAALARAGWASRYPASGYLFSWYGGFHPASYSLLAPYVLAAIGTRLAMAIAVVVSAALLGMLLAWHRIPRPRAAAAWVAIALWTELSAGRAAFTLGLAAGLGCLAVANVSGASPDDITARTDRGIVRPRAGRAAPRLIAAGALALLCCLLSPVAGVFLGVVALALAIDGRWVRAAVIAVAAGLPLAAMALFSDGGVQPIIPGNWLPPLLAVAAALLLIPRRWRLVRVGAVTYGLVVILTLLVPSLMGSNVARLGELLAGPLLVGLGSARRRWLLGIALAGAAVWQVAQPIADLAHGNAAPYAPQTAALVRELRALRADTARVEAVPQYGHWESTELATVVPLARGWERQLDIERNPIFYGGVLTPDAYYRWLRYNAVRYVAISAATPDPAAAAEAATVRAGQPWLVPVWHNAFWRLYRVAGSDPLASRPAVVTATSPASITLRLSRPGTTIVRVHWSALLRAAGAVVSRAGAWTRVTVRAPGSYVLTGRY
jgi:hypothetical protein